MVGRKKTNPPLRRMKTGRRPGRPDTRGAVLDAARVRFASDGFDATTIRGVAAHAGVDPALVMRFYGSKEGLFAAVLEQLADLSETLLASLAGSQSGMGERLTRAYFELWEKPATGNTLRSLVRAAIGSPRASATFQTYLTGRLTGSGIPAPKRLGFVLAASHLFGAAVGRYIVQAPALVDLSLDELVRLISPAVDRYLTTTE
jgi:AcrR family transcriptional regulator